MMVQAPTAQDSLLTWALFYAEVMRWPIFPCLSKGKAPCTTNGLYDASTDPEQIRA